MASGFQSSFIPKGVGGYTPAESAKKGSSGFFGSVAVVLFILVLALILGAFVYKQVLKSTIGNMQTELALAESSVDNTTIETMFAFSQKLSAGREVVLKHKVVSNFLSLLAQNTVQTVTFNELSYQFMPDGALSITLSGTALNYASLALQESAFGKLKEVKQAEFSELGKVESGRVAFKVAIVADPAISVYSPEVAEESSKTDLGSDATDPIGEDASALPDLEDL